MNDAEWLLKYADGDVAATFEFDTRARLRAIADRLSAEPTDAEYEIGRKAVEDELIEWRDARLSELMRRNGLVIREKDGTESSIIRFGPETAIRIGMRAILKSCEQAEGPKS